MRSCVCNIYRKDGFLSKTRRFANLAALISLFFLGTWAYAAATVSTQNVTFPADANIINVKTQYGAAGDGVTDDTAAIQNAVSNAGQGQIVYLPAGTYLVSNTISWKYTWGGSRAWVRLQGQNQSGTVIKLKNNTFTNTANCDVTVYHGNTAGAACQAVLYLATDYNAAWVSSYGAGEDAYMNSVQDLTVDVGSGNPGAIGVDVLISNSGAIRNVTVRSGDGQGRFGIALTRDCCGGPGYLANLTINGFDYGIAAGYSTPQMGYTLEHVALAGQRINGIYNHNFPLWIRDLTSSNSVPTAVNAGIGRLTILDGQFTGGSPSVSAVQDNSSGGVLFLRNISTNGYQSALSRNGAVTAGANLSEYVSKSVQSLFSSAATSMNLPVKETPTYVNNDFTQWANVQAYGATGNGWTDDTAAIQAALNSGKPVIYFPYSKYAVNGTLHIPSSVRLIEGFGSMLQGTITTVSARPGTKFSCEATSGGPVILDNFHYDKYTLSNGQITSITNTCTVPFVMRDLFDFVGYLGNTSADVFWEDAAITGAAQHGGHFYGRQVNVEIGVTHLEFDNATAWVFGYKTEGIGGNGMMWAHNGANVELLGAFHYPNTTPAGVAYTIQNSNVSLVNVGAYVGFSPTVSETRNGATMTMNDGSWDYGIGLGLYSASTTTFGSDTTAPSAPTNLTATAQSSSQISLSWNAASDNVGVAGYHVYRNGALLTTTSSLTYTDAGLSPSTNYGYSVAAFDAANNAGAASNIAYATTSAAADTAAPSVPTGLTTSAISQSSVTISWNASTDNVGVAGYKVYRNGALLTSVSSTKYTDTGVSASTAYSYGVAAYDSANNTSGLSSSISAVTMATTSSSSSASAGDTAPPSIPTGLTATAASSSQVNLSWKASSDNVGVTGYRIYRNNGLLLTTNSLSYSDTSVAASTTYSYTVAATDGRNVSGLSTAVSVTTPSAAAANLVANGGFDSVANWTFFTSGQGTFTSASGGYSGNSASIRITQAGSNVQLFQTGIALKPKTSYTITFAAKASANRTIGVRLLQNVSPYTVYGLDQTVNLTTSWQLYTLTFNTNNLSAAVSDGRLAFTINSAGVAGDQFYLDSVVVR